ncbi:MAG: hypothetical protein NVS4B3_04020 [Gemmatimonadaceae bacterium]
MPKYGNTGVERNRLKRRLRELARKIMLPRLAEHKLTIDVVLRVRPSAYEVAFTVLESAIERMTGAIMTAGPLPLPVPSTHPRSPHP